MKNAAFTSRVKYYIILVLLSFFLFGFCSISAGKIPNFKALKKSEIQQCYFIINANGKVNKVKMSEMETIILKRLFNTCTYTDVYMDNIFNKKILNPYLEVQMKSGKILYLYGANSGFVVRDNKKQYYIDQENYSGFFNYSIQKYKDVPTKANLTNEKYKPVIFKYKNFLDGLKKVGLKFNYIRTAKSGVFSTPTFEIISCDEEININEYKDNIDMEIEAMKVSGDASTIVSVGTIEWAKKPHFFKKGNIIVSYFGDNDKLIKCIEKVMGRQYAG